MKQIFLYLLIIIAFNSCKPNKNIKIESKDVKLKIEDTINDYGLEKLKSIDDFFYMFMLIPDIQKNQIKYPIKVNQQIIKTKKEWTYIPFFSKKRAIVRLSNDTISQINNNSNIEIINIKKRTFINYLFEKQKKNWILVEVKNNAYTKFKDNEFILFFNEFTKNETFQKEHIKFPLNFVFANSEKDYETDTIIQTKEKWKHINLDLDLLLINNTNNNNSDYRIISFSGIENGITIEFVFKIINDEWYLIKYSDFST